MWLNIIEKYFEIVLKAFKLDKNRSNKRFGNFRQMNGKYTIFL